MRDHHAAGVKGAVPFAALTKQFDAMQSALLPLTAFDIQILVLARFNDIVRHRRRVRLAAEIAMQRFMQERNITRFKKLADKATTSEERAKLLNELARERAEWVRDLRSAIYEVQRDTDPLFRA